MGLHRSANQIRRILEDFYASELSIREYSRRNQIPTTTLSSWITKYKIATGDLTCPAGFTDITVPLRQELTYSNHNNNLVPTKTDTEDVINSSFVRDADSGSSKKEIKIIKDGITMVFDVSLLKQVMEVLA